MIANYIQLNAVAATINHKAPVTLIEQAVSPTLCEATTDTITYSTFVPYTTEYTQDDLTSDLEAVFASLPPLAPQSPWNSPYQPVLTESTSWNDALDFQLDLDLSEMTAASFAWDCNSQDDLINAWIDGSNVSPFDFLPCIDDQCQISEDYLVRGMIRIS